MSQLPTFTESYPSQTDVANFSFQTQADKKYIQERYEPDTAITQVSCVPKPGNDITEFIKLVFHIDGCLTGTQYGLSAGLKEGKCRLYFWIKGSRTEEYKYAVLNMKHPLYKLFLIDNAELEKCLACGINRIWGTEWDVREVENALFYIEQPLAIVFRVGETKTFKELYHDQ
jgi:hypothetical protein